jgi:hypothetical protein
MGIEVEWGQWSWLKLWEACRKYIAIEEIMKG